MLSGAVMEACVGLGFVSFGLRGIVLGPMILIGGEVLWEFFGHNIQPSADPESDPTRAPSEPGERATMSARGKRRITANPPLEGRAK